MEQAITQWLPKVSKPGDTVFIYFTGHGGVIPPYKEGDEHVKGSHPLTADFASVGAVVTLLKYRKEHRITAEQEALLDQWLEWIGDDEGADKQAEDMVRHCCVTDDQFGHWLQRLAGRQIVVILDACHSAGFADEGKDLGPVQVGKSAVNSLSTVPRASDNFGYLTTQLTRLKDIGQNETAPLTACGSKESTLAGHMEGIKLPALYQNKELSDGLAPEMSLFSYCLAEHIRPPRARRKLNRPMTPAAMPYGSTLRRPMQSLPSTITN